ncbi:MAG: prolipoprotein diacylglyceryl transferase [Selenomonas artemidis]|uniref:prolipoprotein diacylglyceryl transferase n=1 Tax=Selenomonas artemidis TaxID=671224 RepID=UPI0003FCC55E|nr:prolipoprotein diacylglyceryl transferase [Selenomonas artemidis]
MHQYLFYIGDFPIRAYGVVISLSILLATGVGYFLAKADGRGYEKHVADIGIYCGIAGLLGARLWDVFFFDWDYYRHHLTELLNVWQGGMAIQGGVFLGVVVGILYCRRHHLDTVHFMDVLAPAIVFGQALGRCANLLNGDAFGAPTGGSFGILYPESTLAYHTYGAQALWPAEVWEGQLDIVIFALLLAFRAYGHARGQCFALYVMLYSGVRFLLEYFRGDYTEKYLGLFTSAQTGALAFGLLALAAFVWLGFRKEKETVPAEQHAPEERRKKGKHRK